MPVNAACEALNAGCRLALHYDGVYRIVEVHAVGLNSAGHHVMRVWQTSGGRNNSFSNWRLMRLDKATGLFITDQVSQAPRMGYRRDDQDIQSIVCQV